MKRDFMAERRRQLIAEELNRVFKRVFPDNELGRKIRAIYSQNPLLKSLFDKADKGRR